MEDREKLQKSTLVNARMKAMTLKNGISSQDAAGRIQTDQVQDEANSPRPSRSNSTTRSPVKSERTSRSSDTMKENYEKKTSAEVVVKLEPGHPPKLARAPSQKSVAQPAQLFDSYADKTEEAKESFQVISACIYASKSIGSTEHAMECDCSEEWGKAWGIYSHTVHRISADMFV